MIGLRRNSPSQRIALPCSICRSGSKFAALGAFFLLLAQLRGNLLPQLGCLFLMLGGLILRGLHLLRLLLQRMLQRLALPLCGGNLVRLCRQLSALRLELITLTGQLLMQYTALLRKPSGRHQKCSRNGPSQPGKWM